MLRKKGILKGWESGPSSFGGNLQDQFPFRQPQDRTCSDHPKRNSRSAPPAKGEK